MNDASPPISPASRTNSTANQRDETHVPGGPSSAGRDHEPGTRSSRRRRRRKTIKPDAGLVKKFDFVTHLLKNLDMLVYAELAAQYYMECSAVRFFMRAWCQQNFLSPKPDDWPIPLPAIQAQILSVFFPALLCVLAHIFESLPTAAETSRGYLHGGMIVDFIGQRPPASRLTLLALDLVILAVQGLMLAGHVERERLRLITRPKRSRLITALSEDLGAADSISEGREHHSDENHAAGVADGEENGGIEMQSLRRNDSQPLGAEGDTEERRPFLSDTPIALPTRRIALVDVMNSGNGMLRDLDVFHTLRNSTPDFWGAVGHALQSIGYQATLARIAGRARTLAFGSNQTAR
ncbi:hypothetical protein D7B24_005980 [Verticillium nonalfalfae]|uniref:DUF1746 domain-containing protein n=1 Tax=Verticillium nonalfalfae TaxID=1051616 RepID=A0A3M9YK54_9PEZI|nr:uncharacterized protein D7B24_005980 [Verticillium nonalfalfae]RNJ60829.1 hypothetical protein D7B24_005980 [Verticillium nonalfalfae]